MSEAAHVPQTAEQGPGQPEGHMRPHRPRQGFPETQDGAATPTASPASARDAVFEALWPGTPGETDTQSKERATEMLDALVAEVREQAAADVHRAELPRFAASESPELVAKVVRAVDVRLAEQGPQAPYGVEGTDRSAFFQAGHTYRSGSPFTAPELVQVFQVEHVTRHPNRGHLRAVGWMRGGELGAGWHGDFRDEDEFAGWTDITVDGAR